MNNTQKMIDVLLVEDNIGDVRLTEIAFGRGRVDSKLHVARDGDEALQFLRKEGKFSQAPRPDIILLDLNLPRKLGLDVLKEIKSDEQLKRIPVVILTTSDADSDVLQSYNTGANSYIQKPVDMEKFLSTFASLEEFWLKAVKLPPD